MNGPAPPWWKWPGRLAVEAAVGLVVLYQWTLSPLLRPFAQCRFEPSCSRYMIGALRKYGLLRGGFRGVKRLLRCHPWHPGGYDPP